MKPHADWTNAELAETLPLVETVSPIDREICREAARRLKAALPNSVTDMPASAYTDPQP